MRIKLPRSKRHLRTWTRKMVKDTRSLAYRFKRLNSLTRQNIKATATLHKALDSKYAAEREKERMML